MTTDQRPPTSVSILTVARSLRLDVAAMTACRKLDERGIDSILLKGPRVASVLYRDGAARGYEDIDLLVSPGDLSASVAALKELGYGEPFAGALPTELAAYAVILLDGDIPIDLHHALPEAKADGDRVWAELRQRTETVPLAGAEVRVLDRAALAFFVAAHAAKHGRGDEKVVEDVRRAIQEFATEEWQEALSLATILESREAFSAGLRLVDEGVQIADGLGLPAPNSLLAHLKTSSASLEVQTIERLALAEGWGQRLRLIGRELVPTPGALRHWAPRARTSRVALVAAYCVRPAWLVVRGVPALVSWFIERRRFRRGTSG